MKKFEYKEDLIDAIHLDSFWEISKYKAEKSTLLLETQLSFSGREGWELVYLKLLDTKKMELFDHDIYRAVFKREIQS